MIKSMTGFGAVKTVVKGGFIRVEVRTVNHRYLDISSKLPESGYCYEAQIRELIKQEVRRGKVNFTLGLDTQADKSLGVGVDIKAAKRYYNLLCTLKKELKLDSEIKLKEIVSFPDVIVFKEQKGEINWYWPDIKKAVIAALKKLNSMRKAEGRMIYEDLKTRIYDIKKTIAQTEKKAPKVVDKYRKRLEKRMAGADKNNTRTRVETEISIFSQNSDITEEMVRVKGHLNEFLKNLTSGEDVGKKLDFIAQEIYREANTLSAKANDYSISEEAIRIKNQVEKIREQLQNVE